MPQNAKKPKMKNTNTYAQKSLALHKKLGGKLSISSKVPLKNMKDMSVAYTPGVGAVASHVGKHAKDARVYTMKRNTVAVVSDGSAVLGLGNIGALGALPVMEGKCAIFKEFADIDAFPIVLDTQDTDEIVETVLRIAPGFGGINLEDITAPKCFEVEKRLKQKLAIPVFHDDQHGTAIVVLAGLINALKITKRKKETARVVIVGAGAAGQAIAELLHRFGLRDIVVVDRKGVIHKKRAKLNVYKKRLARFNTKHVSGALPDALAGADAVVGVSGPGMLTVSDIAVMADDPIVFALANPVPEIMPADAKKGGARVIATGRSDFPNQINNSLVFPGIFRGALDRGVAKITDEMKLRAAVKLAGLVKTPTPEKFIPNTFDKGVMRAIAQSVR